MSRAGRVLVLGGTGFVGSAIAAEAQRRGWRTWAVGSRDVATIELGEYDVVINADGNSRKYLAAEQPMEDFDRSVRTVATSLHTIRCRHYILISSSEVYPFPEDPSRNAEDAPIDPSRLSPYGVHKFLAEILVQRFAPRWGILRLSGLVGPRLKKNAIFDLLTGAPLHVHPDSAFQFLDTRRLAAMLFELLEEGALNHAVFNCGGVGTVTVRQVAEWIGRPIPPEADTRPRVRCELNLARLAARVTIPATVETVRAFVSEWRRGERTS